VPKVVAGPLLEPKFRGWKGHKGARAIFT
jgi:hypothetical protein